MKDPRQLILSLGVVLLLQQAAWVSSFQPQGAPLLVVAVSSYRIPRTLPTLPRSSFRLQQSTGDTADNNDSSQELEKTWRYVKKTLLSIGGKGATASHGNSLKELLECHVAVKVKVNMKPFGTYVRWKTSSVNLPW